MSKNDELKKSGDSRNGLVEQRRTALTVSTDLDLDWLLQQILAAARQVTRARYAALGIVGDDGLVKLFLSSGVSSAAAEQLGELPRPDGLLSMLLKEGSRLRIASTPADTTLSASSPLPPRLGMPLSYMGRVVGALYLSDKENGEGWSAEDEWLSLLLANHAAVALGNGYLYLELKQEREQAEADRHRLALILEDLPEGIVICDQQGNITMCSARAMQMLGFAVGGNVHQRTYATSHADGSAYDDHELPLTRTLVHGERVDSQHMVVQPPAPGEALDVLTSSAPLLDPSGQLAGAIAVYQDISYIKAAERLKDEFFSMATHELRTPLTSITLSAGLLAELVGGQGGKVEVLARLVDDGAQRMRRLVDDLLDLSRLEHGRLTLYRREFNLATLIEHASTAIAPLAERKGQRLTFKLPRRAVMVNADATRIEQVILNLLANAVKYTPEGGDISLSVGRGKGESVVAVTDNGPGVAEQERKRIFERFYRTSEATMGSASGTGLGLPIARMLVETHGGRLWVEEALGGGSVFRFSIPD